MPNTLQSGVNSPKTSMPRKAQDHRESKHFLFLYFSAMKNKDASCDDIGHLARDCCNSTRHAKSSDLLSSCIVTVEDVPDQDPETAGGEGIAETEAEAKSAEGGGHIQDQDLLDQDPALQETAM